MNELLTHQVLIVEDPATAGSVVANHAIERVVDVFIDYNVDVLRVDSYEEALPMVRNNMDIDAFLISTDMNLAPLETTGIVDVLRAVAERQTGVPVFLLADRDKTSQAMNAEIMAMATEFVWIFEDSPVFIADRVMAAINRFRKTLMPPLMTAIWAYNKDLHEYSWAAPGHQGGVGFTKTPAGKKFYDFYGENLFRTDTGIERYTIGSLLDHSGAFHDSEIATAKVFGADQSYSVVVGTSGSNRTVMSACMTDGDIAICDRNCHKSIEQGLIQTGAIPIYMIPTRNRYGIIGPIPSREMTPGAIRKKVDNSPLPHSGKMGNYAVLTNCTYDGICYNAKKAEDLLAQSSDRVHFDEAWYAYARFNPMYIDHFAMRGDPKEHRGPTVFATHSTHKLLAALSQASYIHVRNGRNAIEFNRFNQSYMMQATTSPLYAICASNDIATEMMKRSGHSLTQEVIDEAVDYRQCMARLYRDFTKSGSWFFKPWNADKVTCPKSGKVYEFADAPRDLLRLEQSCWSLKPNENWHGFGNIDPDWALLDPIKVSILTPGMGDDGKLQPCGIPAILVSNYLFLHGIVPTRSTDSQLMFLFSIGITKGKWGTLVNTLLKFKQHYDANDPVAEVIPNLAEANPERYGTVGLRDLSDEMYEYLRQNNPGSVLDAAFQAPLPKQVLPPRSAYNKIMSNEVELVPSTKLANRVAANAVIPYPPGIPMLISGESFGPSDSPQITYLHTLETWNHQFPGFENITEGAEIVDGLYNVLCIK